MVAFRLWDWNANKYFIEQAPSRELSQTRLKDRVSRGTFEGEGAFGRNRDGGGEGVGREMT